MTLYSSFIKKYCSRLSSNAAPASEWRCSRGRDISVSVTRCPDDQEAGACAMTPDFRVPGTLNSEDGLEPASEDQDEEESTEAESDKREKTKRRSGSLGVSRETVHPEDQERSKDTLGSCHVPGGAWLTKVRSFLKDNRLLKRGEGGRKGEGKDGEEGVGEGSSWEGVRR
ncbi:hypothetical protein NDU88_002313 [Pleurodeles waltl]|uniref:Uncharacterized protein n=1 Tax=Pleurodeles waltl TaxID=8319 RepID=A0AAV7VAU0_PLEWA|nr:hypothetical protein NDU88_002313 [Pleurodeles waltl]